MSKKPRPYQIGGASKGTMLKACEHAIALNVPSDFAYSQIKNIDAIKQARDVIANVHGNEFKMLDVYEQYGNGIKYIYEVEKRNTAPYLHTEMKNVITNFIKPQIETLESEGTRPVINDTLFIYVFMLATGTQPEVDKSIPLEAIKALIKHLFPSEEEEALIEQWFNVVCDMTNFDDLCIEMIPVVDIELESKRGEFFIRYSRHVANYRRSRPAYTSDYDPSKVVRTSYQDI